MTSEEVRWLRAILFLGGKGAGLADWDADAENEAIILDLAARDPAVAEDVRSVHESMHYWIRPDEATPPIPCECCGTLVTLVPVADVRAGQPCRYCPAIWDTRPCSLLGGRLLPNRKHTLRRCGYLRKRALAT